MLIIICYYHTKTYRDMPIIVCYYYAKVVRDRLLCICFIVPKYRGTVDSNIYAKLLRDMPIIIHAKDYGDTLIIIHAIFYRDTLVVDMLLSCQEKIFFVGTKNYVPVPIIVGTVFYLTSWHANSVYLQTCPLSTWHEK